MFDQALKEVVISSIAFGDAAVEIGYFEKRDQAQRAGLMKTLVMDRTLFAAKLDEIQELIEEIIDDALLEIRNPEESLDPRQRISKQVEDEVEKE